MFSQKILPYDQDVRTVPLCSVVCLAVLPCGFAPTSWANHIISAVSPCSHHCSVDFWTHVRNLRSIRKNRTRQNQLWICELPCKPYINRAVQTVSYSEYKTYFEIFGKSPKAKILEIAEIFPIFWDILSGSVWFCLDMFFRIDRRFT